MTGKSPIDEALAQVPEELREKMRGALEKSFARPEESATDAVYDTVRRRAALAGAFDPAQLLPQDLPEEQRQGVLGRLLGESTVTLRRGHRLWMLGETARKEVLRSLSAEAVRSEVSASSKALSEDELSQALARYVSGSARPLQEQSVDELAKTAVVSQWLEGTPFEAPAPERVRQELGFAQLLRPFDELLRDGFAGRTAELRKLRDYVGVRPPESWAGWGRRELRNLSRLLRGRASYHPFVVRGAGGIGKSTLMAKFLVEHARQEEERRFPFIYLDFDRATLLPRQPLSLLQEMAQQLASQFPQLGKLFKDFGERQRSHLERRLAERHRVSQSADSASMEEVGRDPRLVSAAASELRDAVRALTDQGRPFLLVLDTFEEVQRAGDDDVAEVLSLVRTLSDDGRWETFRVVISGRAPLEGYDIVQEIVLKELDRDSAREFLRKKLPVSRQMIEEIVSHVGGRPLALKLAAGIIQKHLESVPEEQLRTRELVGVKRGLLARAFAEFDDMRIEVQLYRRILEHIGDPDVEKLAHPGFILRQLTPELIMKVLAEPCGLKGVDEARARVLFEKMAKEVALVTRTGDVLIHRRDVRAAMLDLIHEDLDRESPGKFEQINARAAAYYAERKGPENRAEELYHYLLGGEVARAERRWSVEAEPYLSRAASELPAPARVFLKARLNQELKPKERELLDSKLWTQYAQRQAEQLLRRGKPDEARELLTSREPAAPSITWSRLLGMALEDTAEFELALEEYKRGERTSGTVEERFLLYRAYAELLLKKGDSKALSIFIRGEELAREQVDSVAALEFRVGRMGAERRVGKSSTPLASGAFGLANSLPRTVWKQAPGVLRRLVLFAPGDMDARTILDEYFRVAPLTSLNERECERLEALQALDGASDEVRTLLERARKELGASGGLDVFAFDAVPPAVVRALHDWLDSLVREGPAAAVELAKALLVTRHAEWRMPARFALLRTGRVSEQELAERFLPAHRLKLFSRQRVKSRARELVDHADDCGRLPELLRTATESEGASAALGVAEALDGWDRFLRSLVREDRPEMKGSPKT